MFVCLFRFPQLQFYTVDICSIFDVIYHLEFFQPQHCGKWLSLSFGIRKEIFYLGLLETAEAALVPGDRYVPVL